MSNTSTMAEIVRKFPRPVGEKWNEHLSSQDGDTKLKPFETFVKWLGTQREMWERMAATELPRSRSARSHFSDNDRVGNVPKSCYYCKEEGHIMRDCPKVKQKPKQQKPRKDPEVKKFWCALHKEDPSRNCFTNSCQALQKLEFGKRNDLLKQNGDCFHCCGDHKPESCPKKDRKCGGIKGKRVARKITTSMNYSVRMRNSVLPLLVSTLLVQLMRME